MIDLAELSTEIRDEVIGLESSVSFHTAGYLQVLPITGMVVSRNNIINHMAMHIRQPVIASLMSIGQAFVVNPKLVHQCGMKVVNRDLIAHRSITKVICLAVDEPRFESASSDKCGEAICMMVTATEFFDLVLGGEAALHSYMVFMSICDTWSHVSHGNVYNTTEPQILYAGNNYECYECIPYQGSTDCFFK